MVQIWNTYKGIECWVDKASKIQDRRRSRLPKDSGIYRPKIQMNQLITQLKCDDLPTTMRPSLAEATQEFDLSENGHQILWERCQTVDWAKGNPLAKSQAE
jgi:hypothetical protein